MDLEGKKYRVHDLGVKSTKLKMEAGDAQSNAAAWEAELIQQCTSTLRRERKQNKNKKIFKLGGKWSFQESFLYSHK